MRADVRNTGRSPFLNDSELIEASAPIRRWSTGNGIFSTPIIGADETVYVGSADKRFYAFDPVSGTQRWSFPTGECIDSAGCIAADDTVYFVSCDAGLYALSPSGEERWRLNLFEDRRHFTPSTIFWWEGNVVLGPNGLLYAGNDDFNFAIEPGKGVRWAY
jgi:outer membrane protein assembly factor BamB